MGGRCSIGMLMQASESNEISGAAGVQNAPATVGDVEINRAHRGDDDERDVVACGQDCCIVCSDLSTYVLAHATPTTRFNKPCWPCHRSWQYGRLQRLHTHIRSNTRSEALPRRYVPMPAIPLCWNSEPTMLSHSMTAGILRDSNSNAVNLNKNELVMSESLPEHVP